MNEETWQRVEDIFHHAIELAPMARAAYLDQACGLDHALRREVESLLAHDAEDGLTFAGPVDADIPRTIGPYRISGKLGAGGMGIVYRATDSNLARDVAIKVLPISFAQDADRCARFTREAKVLASLNHPNIAQIYSFEDRALVMELILGQALRGPLPLETALDYARQIASALEAAHEKGIVHRDLKPGNIMVTPEGVVKLLDFGLAAVSPEAAPLSDPEKSPALTMQATRRGLIMGTAAYMSPEQAEGKTVDKRADIWSFGVVLWEMLTGHRLFEGESVSQTLAGVLRGVIDFNQLPLNTPATIRRLLSRCLERTVKNRLRDIGEARIAIEAAVAGGDAVEESAAAKGIQQWRWPVIAASFGVALAALSIMHFREKPPEVKVPLRVQVQLSEPGAGLYLAPDGRKAAMTTRGRLTVYFLESGETRDLSPADSAVPFWSPDSQFIGYVSQNKLMRIAAEGGPPQNITDFTGVWGCGAWNQDDVIVFGDRRIGLFRIAATGGTRVQITALDPARQENSHYCPSFLPDGRHFVYPRSSANEDKTAIFAGSVDAKPEQQSRMPLAKTNSQPIYAPSGDPNSGHLLFIREGTLFAQPFDNRKLDFSGPAVPLAKHVSIVMQGTIFVPFSASANGMISYRDASVLLRQPMWFDRDGKFISNLGEAGLYGAVVLSPDGTKAVASRNSGGAEWTNLWLFDLTRQGAATRLTFSSAADHAPVWSPDGKHIVFASDRGGLADLYQKSISGAQEEQVILKSGETKIPTSWSRDGRFLLYTSRHPQSKADIWVLPLEKGRMPRPFLRSNFKEGQAQFSPDGHWVAYTSDESGRDEVYVRAFSTNADGSEIEAGAKYPVSNGIGLAPHWRADGRELYYRTLDSTTMAVAVSTQPVFRTGSPIALGVPKVSLADISSDGQRFVVLSRNGSAPPFNLLVNWQAGLKK